jgi:hypothetical protein
MNQPIPNQSIFGVPLQSVYGSNTNPWGAPGYAQVANPGIATGQNVPYGANTPETAVLSDADRAGLEVQALNGFLQQATAHSIRRLFQYLETHSTAHPQLNAQLPALTQAVDAYRAGHFPQAFTLAFQVFRAITLLQAVNRELPALPAS